MKNPGSVPRYTRTAGEIIKLLFPEVLTLYSTTKYLLAKATTPSKAQQSPNSEKIKDNKESFRTSRLQHNLPKDVRVIGELRK